MFLIISVFVMMFSSRIFTKQTILKSILIISSVFLSYFVVFSTIKYNVNIDTFSESLIDGITSFLTYLSSPSIAFCIFADNLDMLDYGDNMFRGIYAILNAIGFDFTVQDLVKPFVDYSFNSTTNVYTIFQYPVSDFGFLFGFIYQLFLGVFHGILYNMKKQREVYIVYVYAIFMYPLVMQFFQDQYISLLSTWIQLLFWGWLIIKISLIGCERTINI